MMTRWLTTIAIGEAGGVCYGRVKIQTAVPLFEGLET
jgi:hypothetical protein